MQTLILKIEYDGQEFCGWQIQPKDRSVQAEIEKALHTLLKKEIKIIGAGRTDSGVHAMEMTASAEINFGINIPPQNLAKAINSKLPNDVYIKSAIISNNSFHARFDAQARSYKYYIHTKPSPIIRHYSTLWLFPLDEKLLFKSAEIFLTKTNFTTFSKNNPDTKNHICDVEISEWKKIDDNKYEYSIKADRFIYGMVRSIVGTMLDIARGYSNIDEVKELLLSKDRSKSSALAPAHGLFFEKAYYQ